MTANSGVRVGLTRLTLRPGTKSGSSADGFLDGTFAFSPDFDGGTDFCNALRIAFNVGGSSDGSERTARPFSTVPEMALAVFASIAA